MEAGGATSFSLPSMGSQGLVMMEAAPDTPGTAAGEFLLKITLAGICSENQDRESSGMMAAQYESHVTV